jgi:hypothetical protein
VDDCATALTEQNRMLGELLQGRGLVGLVRDGKPPADAQGALQWLAQSPQTLLAAVDA